MGSVWLAKHETLGSDVAVKLMSPVLAGTQTAKIRFEREAKASAQLKSPHIVKVSDYGVEGGTPFMAMELLAGEDLNERLERRGRLSLQETARLSTQICKALKVAHDSGLVHRDLKPGNIYLAKEGDEEVVKLLDFGIARETHGDVTEDKTSTGVIVGSPYHMSPEQAQAKRVDGRSDLWSLGVLLYRALTGRRPFEGDSMTAVLLAVVSSPFPRVSELCPDLPKDLDRFFARALERDVSRRFSDAPSMAAAFEAIANGEDATTWLDVPEAPESAPRSRGAGRDEPTMDVAPVSSAGPVPIATEPTMGAITTGVRSIPKKRGRSLSIAIGLALAVAVGAGGFLAGRVELKREPDAQSDAAGARAASPVTIAPSTIATAAPSVTAAEPASASAVATSDAPIATNGRVRSRPSTKTKGAKKPALDPFTGLPLSP
jgi:serine/threonine protein kinase